ncbi:MAG TPA: NADH-quinone oxidoreductase subunit L, partial [Coriobacteriia bacterium]|nr:NADH-quinone oxidoreductase subunit L [Coriobacteriia bacterium]
FALISLFTGSMNLLVLAGGFTTVFVGWELVGACSFLLIGFWYEKPTAAAAAIKAFLTTRVGDVGLLLGIALLWSATGAESYHGALAVIDRLNPALVTAAAICIAIGAMGKSAQFPLHGWLPDAMEGPTPVSALIHAATMVAAGVFLVARVWPLFEAAEGARTLLLIAGSVSALGAAGAAVVQRDIKKVLAYSTISQLGFMFAALGAGAWTAAFFHLVAHAAFKALLFLGSGSVIHGTGTQDLYEMGGLRKTMPVTFFTWAIGVLALAGVFPFAGFFSKDAVLEAVWAHAPFAGIALFLASLLTAFYAARVTRLAFFGEPAEGLHAHESGVSMLLPLAVLAVPAVVLGFAAGNVTALLGHEPEPLAMAISGLALMLAAIGGIAGWRSAAGPEGDAATRARLGGLGDRLAAAYNWDALVDRTVVRPTVALSRTLWAVGDRFLADGAAEGLAELARRIGGGFSSMQTGDVQGYASMYAVAIVVMLLVSMWAGRWIG